MTTDLPLVLGDGLGAQGRTRGGGGGVRHCQRVGDRDGPAGERRKRRRATLRYIRAGLTSRLPVPLIHSRCACHDIEKLIKIFVLHFAVLIVPSSSYQ